MNLQERGGRMRREVRECGKKEKLRVRESNSYAVLSDPEEYMYISPKNT